MTLPDGLRKRLMQLFAMTGSAHDGEALNALRLAQRMAEGAGTTLVEALEAPVAAPPVVNQQTLDLKRLAQLEEDAYRRGFAAGEASVSVAAASGLRPAPDRPVPAGLPWVDWCKDVLAAFGPRLTAWEQGFLKDFMGSGWPTPTVRQHGVMERIARKCGVALPDDVVP